MSNLIANMLNSNSFAERKRITDMFIKYNYEGRLKTFFLPLLRKMTLKERKRFLILLDNLINKTEYSAKDIKFIIKYLNLPQRKILNDLLLNALFDPASIEGLILWTRASIEERDDWQRETFQLDNEVLIDGLTKDLEYPLFSGANNNLERVTLDSTITLDCTIGWRVKFYFLANGSLGSGVAPGFGFMGDGLTAGFNTTTSTNQIYVNDSTAVVNVGGLLLRTQIIHELEIECDTVDLIIYQDGIQKGSTSIGLLTTINIRYFGQGRFREAQGLLYDIKINDVDNSENWTHYYSGINGDWSDQIGSNNGTAGVNLKYIKNNHNNLKAKTGGYYVADSATGDYIDSNTTFNPSSDYTVCTWINTTDSNAEIIDNRDGSGNGLLLGQSIGKLIFGHNTTLLTTLQDYNDGVWYFVVIKKNGNEISLQVYNHEIIVGSDTSVISTTSNLLIGVNAVTFGDYWSGSMYNTALFNTALTASQISNLYNNPQRFVELSREYGAERIYDFNIGNGEVGYPVFDLSGNDQHGTIQSNLAPAGTNFIYNDAEVGTQQVLESRNVYRWFNTNGATGVNLNSSIILAGDFDISLKLLTNIFDLNPSGRRLLSNASNRDAIYYDNIGRLSIRLDTENRAFTTKVLELGVLNNVRVQRVGGEITATINDQLAGTVSSASPLEISAIGYARSTNKNRTDGIISNININNQAAYKGYGTTPWKDEVGTNNGSETGTFGALFIPESSTKGIDLFGNTIENRWKQGLLNFTGLNQTIIDNVIGGVAIGNQIDTIDTTNGFVYATAFKWEELSTSQQWFLTNRISDDGIGVFQQATGRITYVNEVSAASTNLVTSNNTLVSENYYCLIITHFGTTASIYVTELNTDFTTPEVSGTVGLKGNGTQIPTFGLNALVNSSMLNVLKSTDIVIDTDVFTLTDMNNLRKYLKSLIS